MKTSITIPGANKKNQGVIKLTKDGLFFAQCTRDGNATRNFPFKSFKTEMGAYKYILRFLKAVS